MYFQGTLGVLWQYEKGKDEWWKSQAAEIQLQGIVGTYLSAKEVVEEYRENGGSNGPSCG